MVRPTNQQLHEQRMRKYQRRMLAGMLIVTLVGMLACGYGHAAVSRDLLIEGEGRIGAKASF